MNAAIVTAIFGAYDPLPPICPQDGDVEWVCVTDDPDLEGPGWRIIVDDPHPDLARRDAAYGAKMRPWRYTDRPASIWVDASIHVTSPRFAFEALDHAWPLAMWPHPNRDCLYDEIKVTASMDRYVHLGFYDQALAYHAAGHPAHWGLWCCGVIARRHTADARDLADAWAAEVAAWPGSDQQALPFALRDVGLRPHELPGQLTDGEWFDWRQSQSHFR